MDRRRPRDPRPAGDRRRRANGSSESRDPRRMAGCAKAASRQGKRIHPPARRAQRRPLPQVKIDKEYLFEGPNGQARMLDLFEGRRQHIVYHFMFDPSWDEGCPMCSFLVDNIGHLAHLHARGTSLALVSRAPLSKIKPFKARMGWTFPWYSSFGNDFNYDFHATLDEDVAPIEYNYRSKEEHEQAGMSWFTRGELPGLSIFLRDGAEIFHTYSTYARGGDLLIGTYNYLDLTPL